MMKLVPSQAGCMMSSLGAVMMIVRLTCGLVIVKLSVRGLMMRHSQTPLKGFAQDQQAALSAISAAAHDIEVFYTHARYGVCRTVGMAGSFLSSMPVSASKLCGVC